MIQYACVNGDIVSAKEAKIAIKDLALLRGYGVFDYFKTVNGRPVWLDDHLDRLFYSSKEMGLEPAVSREQLIRTIQQLSVRNQISNCGTRITITGGYSESGYSIGTPNILITQEVFAYDHSAFYKGIRLITYEHQRQLSHVKSIDYLQAIRLQGEIKSRGADDVLYYHHSGMVRECPRSNFFVVRNGEIATPASGVLAGITRKKILTLPGFSAIQKDFHYDELGTVDEAFITSTSKVVLPVLEINGKMVGDGKPGKTTTAIWCRFLSC